MTTTRNWDRLPTEVLLNIFQHVQLTAQKSYDTSEENYRLWRLYEYPYPLKDPKLKDMLVFQLVCKGWASPAQKLIYQDVLLRFSIAEFVETITSITPKLALLVKKLTLCRTFSSDQLDALLNNCANIDILWPVSPENHKLVWSWLIVEGYKLPHLKAISSNPSIVADNPNLYSLVALQLQNTLADLTIRIKLPKADSVHPFPPDGRFEDLESTKASPLEDHRRLTRRLKSFRALQTLRIAECELDPHRVLDQIIDDLPQTVKKLKIRELGLWDWEDEDECTTKANHTVKELKIDSLMIDLDSLLYLLHKFTALERLKIRSLEFMHIEQANEEYWDQLTRLCAPLKQLSINMEFGRMSFQTAVEHCTAILARTKPLKRAFSLKVIKNQKPEADLKIKYKGGLAKVAIVVPETRKHEVFDDLDSWIQSFSPDSVYIDGIEPTSQYHGMFSPTPRGRGMPSSIKCKTDKTQFFRQKCNVKDWKVFTSALSTSSATPSLVFENIVLSDRPPLSLNYGACQNSKVDTLNITDSILHPMIFPIISRRLPTIGSLSLLSNRYLNDEENTFKIFMPETTITKMFHLKFGSCRNRGCIMEDQALTQAMSATGTYILKVETEAETHITKRQGSKVLETLNPATFDPEEHEEFLIWLKFKAINTYSIDGPGKPSSSYDGYLEIV